MVTKYGNLIQDIEASTTTKLETSRNALEIGKRNGLSICERGRGDILRKINGTVVLL